MGGVSSSWLASKSVAGDNSANLGCFALRARRLPDLPT